MITAYHKIPRIAREPDSKATQRGAMPKLIPQNWRSRQHNYNQALRTAVQATTTSMRCFCYFHYHNCPTNLILFQLPSLPEEILPRAHFFVSLTSNSKFRVGTFDLGKPRPHAPSLVSLRLKVKKKNSPNISEFKCQKVKKITETFYDTYSLSPDANILSAYKISQNTIHIFPSTNAGPFLLSLFP